MDYVKSIKAQTDLAITKTYTEIENMYFVTACTNNGTRFYSDPLKTLEKAEEQYNQYIDVMKYFNGGSVSIYKILAEDYEVIAFTRI